MKINEVERILGITKANIRFYEKENLITPDRTEKGYREYSEQDVDRLKEIIIYRKLGIPVQQIADILDGAVSLQDALDDNIQSLNTQIDTLSGSLALCRQLQSEQVSSLDTERYWKLIREQEKSGYQFQSLVDDYLRFTEVNYDWLLWPLPGESLRSPKKVISYILILSTIAALLRVRRGGNFLLLFLSQVTGTVTSLLFWTAIFVPLFFLSRKHAKTANLIMNIILIGIPVVAVMCILWIFASAIPG